MSINNLRKINTDSELKFNLDFIKNLKYQNSGTKIFNFFPSDTIRINENQLTTKNELLIRGSLNYISNTKKRYYYNRLNFQASIDKDEASIILKDKTDQEFFSRQFSISNEGMFLKTNSNNLKGVSYFLSYSQMPQQLEINPGKYNNLFNNNNPYKSLVQKVANTQIWKSIFRHGPPNNARNRAAVIAGNVFLHLHPIKLKKSGVQLGYTWCMGGLTFFIFLALTVTGILLMFYYRPTAEYAYNDIIGLREHVPLGIMREIHRWGAHSMVITVWLHMFRVFMTGSYKPPREFNWGVGVILLVLTLLLSFTGYLLPWDQLAIWAITVGSNMAKATPLLGHGGPGAALAQIGDFIMVSDKNDVRFQLLGGRFVGEAALLRFYILHCVFIPVVVAVLIAVHFWRVRKDGGISAPL